MLKIALVMFRECLEISLILGIICAATKTVKNSTIYIVSGIMLGFIAAAFLAFFISSLTFALGGFGEELFDVAVILLTVIVVGVTAIWIKKSAYNMNQKVKNITERIDQGLASRMILTSVVATTIFREVTEIILYVSALSSAYDFNPTDYLLGFGLGISCAIIVAVSLYYGLSNFAIKYLFKVSFILLVLIAASLASEAAGILTSIGFLDFYNDPLWDSSWIISDLSIFGRMLKILVGYNSKPNAMQIIFYTSTIIVILCCARLGEKNNVKATR
ncbi:MAG UNVERIFIED_CONTAM: FTR1 family protein [Rickettsiaceae bacterium]|jgi:high-affinity iron transporter